MVCEYLESRQNIEYMFRKRKQQNLFWKQEEIEKMIVSVISTLSYLQGVGICHRDLKPANLFLMPETHEVKLIDFGESKDYFKDGDDGGPGTMATIRGTPQYLSPLLWKAHVEEGGNSRHAQHNIFKSDVFSVGLLFIQFASMEDVTGYNQKNSTNDCEKLIEIGLKKLKQRYSEHIIEIIRLMLKFEECDRPSFTELSKLVLTSTENTLESPKAAVATKGSIPKSGAMDSRKVSKVYSMRELKDQPGIVASISDSKLGPNRLDRKNITTSEMPSSQREDLMTQAELFRSYADSNHLYLNLTNNMMWFEFGGNKIARLHVEGPESEEFPKWRLFAKYKGEFPCHFTTVFVNGGAAGTNPLTELENRNVGSWFLLGGLGNNCLQFLDKNIHHRAPMPSEISFFPAVCVKGLMIYTFGGYENIEKSQVKQCEIYNIEKDRWYRNECSLSVARSQSSACLFRDNIIFIFGGYSKDAGTLDSIERYDIDRKRITLIELKMPCALRRFATMKISCTKILMLGGISRLSKDSDAVYCFDCNEESGRPNYTVESLDKIDKAGVVDSPVVIDSVGSLQLFVENQSGTAPLMRSVYSFLEYS